MNVSARIAVVAGDGIGTEVVGEVEKIIAITAYLSEL